jgi:hypothetical protein
LGFPFSHRKILLAAIMAVAVGTDKQVKLPSTAVALYHFKIFSGQNVE